LSSVVSSLFFAHPQNPNPLTSTIIVTLFQT
jgi:hypothetical protein